MFIILEKYGIPKELLNIIKKMYADVQLRFTLGTEKLFINYVKGVFQGDNASPILFLFITMAAIDSFTASFGLKDTSTFHYFPEKKNVHNNMADSNANGPVQNSPPL
jgi:hypothetical protein